MVEGKGQFQLLEDDHLQFQRHYFKRSLKLVSVLIGMALVAVLCFFLTGLIDGPTLIITAFAAVFCPMLILCGIYVLLLPRQSRRLFRQSAALGEPTQITLSHEAIHFDQESGNWRVKWGDTARWDETSAFLAVFPNSQIAHILPKRDLTPELIQFAKDQLVKAGLPRPWKLRK